MCARDVVEDEFWNTDLAIRRDTCLGYVIVS